MSIDTSPLPPKRAVIIEIGELSAGIALPDGKGYRFIAVDPQFSVLEGSHFRTPGQAELAARNVLAAQRPRDGQTRGRERSFRAA